MAKPIVVVGDGWSALSAVSSLLWMGDSSVVWIAGSSSRILSPLPSFETAYGTAGLERIAQVASRLGIELGEVHSGSFLREFKNKAFRAPSWVKADSSETKACHQNREEVLWGPEQNIGQLSEARFDWSSAEIEEAIRAHLIHEENPRLKRIEGNTLSGLRIENGEVVSVTLASGEEIQCSLVIYADRWNWLGKVQGLPKGLPFTRNREGHGVLQATFTHATPVGVGVLEGFFGVMNREAGEEFDRRLWGYFSSDGKKSFWTICLAAEEAEDNHEIAKKLRRMKSTLDKMFTGTSWIPHPEQGFMANVSDEQVRFEESLIFSDTDFPTETIGIPEIKNLTFATDGYGPARAFEQIVQITGPLPASGASLDLPVEPPAIGAP